MKKMRLIKSNADKIYSFSLCFFVTFLEAKEIGLALKELLGDCSFDVVSACPAQKFRDFNDIEEVLSFLPFYKKDSKKYLSSMLRLIDKNKVNFQPTSFAKEGSSVKVDGTWVRFFEIQH